MLYLLILMVSFVVGSIGHIGMWKIRYDEYPVGLSCAVLITLIYIAVIFLFLATGVCKL